MNRADAELFVEELIASFDQCFTETLAEWGFPEGGRQHIGDSISKPGSKSEAEVDVTGRVGHGLGDAINESISDKSQSTDLTP